MIRRDVFTFTVHVRIVSLCFIIDIFSDFSEGTTALT